MDYGKNYTSMNFCLSIMSRLLRPGFYKISQKIWPTLQELTQIDLHSRREIVWCQNFFVLQNYTFEQEKFVELVFVWEQYLTVLHIDTDHTAFVSSTWIERRWMWDGIPYIKPNLSGRRLTKTCVIFAEKLITTIAVDRRDYRFELNQTVAKEEIRSPTLASSS